MPNPVCISPLKFYDSLAKQSHRKSYAYGHISPLITKTGWIPPFQFVIPTSLYNAGGELVNAYLYDAHSDKVVSSNLKQTLIDAGFTINTIADYKLAVFNPLKNIRNSKAIQSYLDDHWLLSNNTLSSGITSSWKTYYKIPVKAGDIVYYKKNTSSMLDSSASFYIITDLKGIVLQQLNGGNSFSEFKYTMPVDGYASMCCYFTSGIQQDNISVYENREGIYYLKLTSGNGGLWTYYSEVFCFTNVTKDCLELEYWNETGNFAIKNGIIAFPNNFHFKLLLKTEIGKPEYNFEEESTKRLGYIFVESQVSKKTYKFNAVVPEYICDALRLVRLCDNKIIRCKDDEYEAITFEMEAEWQTQGDLASVTCEFETDNVIANIGGFVPDKLGGDYNNDYNEDFDKE